MTVRHRFLLAALMLLPMLASPVLAQEGSSAPLGLEEPVHATALAVALTEDGRQVGSSASIWVSVATEGSGHVFIDTRPLAGTDMQGSARIAARVASALTGYALEDHDFFFAIRSSSPIIAGPSAGGVMTAAAVAALENAHLEVGEERWELNDEVMATGTIQPDGTIGPVGGILTKAEAAADRGAHTFLVPEGQGTYTPRQIEGGLLVEGDQVNVSTWCQEELSITCREVGTIGQFVRLTTGHAFDQGPPATNPSTADYNETMAPLSQQLLEESRVYQETWAALNASSISPAGEQAVSRALEEAHGFYRQAQVHWENTAYYSAASRAFSASIHGAHAGLLLEFFENGSSVQTAQDALKQARTQVRAAEEAAGQAQVTGMNTLYTVGAAQERVSDAEARLASAQARLNESDLNGALLDTAWAMERSETVHWWLSLGEPFGAGPALPVEVEQLADEFITLADEMLAYAGSVLQQQGGPARAAEQLARAKADDRRGFHAAAVVEAAQAQVQATLQVEVQTGTLTQDKVNTSQQTAARAIQDARARGVEPVLAVAMFEFAGAQEDLAISLEFYRTARIYAGFSQVLTGETEPNPSRFVGHLEGQAPARTLPADIYKQVAVGWLTIGVFSTLAVGTLGMAIARRES